MSEDIVTALNISPQLLSLLGNCLSLYLIWLVPYLFFFFQAEDGIRDLTVTGVQTCALPIWRRSAHRPTCCCRETRAARRGRLRAARTRARRRSRRPLPGLRRLGAPAARHSGTPSSRRRRGGLGPRARTRARTRGPVPAGRRPHARRALP